MPTSIDWADDERSVVLVKVDDPYDWSHLVEAYQAAVVLISLVDYPVDLIHDARGGSGAGLPAFQQIQQIAASLPPTARRCVIVGATPLVRDLALSFARSTGNEDRLLFRDSIEEALEALRALSRD